MTAPNHVTGGIVFTGLFCSLFSINIFANPIYITVCLVGSLLPDIDHTKSWIGKSVYPLARWLSINYGHRTITHSLLFIISISIISIFTEHNFSNNYHISTILFFSILSHFIFDMVTLQGIPLFYPFYKNPCVLPANPEMRIKSGNMRQEGVILFIFCFLTFFMQDLFAQGFWTTINNQFNDVKHTIREFKNNSNALRIDYNYNIYQNNYSGPGILIQTTESDIFILSKNRILKLESKQIGLKINKLKTTKTKLKINHIKTDFYEISESKLNSILHNKFITQCLIYSNYNTSTNLKPLDLTKKIELTNQYNLVFKSNVIDTLILDKQNKINELKLKIKSEQNQLINDNKTYYRNINELQNQKNKLKNSLSNYELNETKKNIIELENKVQNQQPKTNLLIQEYQNQLSNLINSKINEIKYTGSITTAELY